MSQPDQDIPEAAKGNYSITVLQAHEGYNSIVYPLEIDAAAAFPKLQSFPIVMNLNGISEKSAESISALVNGPRVRNQQLTREEILRTLAHQDN